MVKMSQSGANMNTKSQKLFEMRPELGEQDLISALPDDCLFSIFSYLDPDSFETMETVSQKMNYIANDKSCVKHKTSVSKFIIKQVSGRFTLQVKLETDNSRVIFDNGRYDDVPSDLFPIPDEANSSDVPEGLFTALEKLQSRFYPYRLVIHQLHADEAHLKRLKSIFLGKFPSVLSLEYITTDQPSSLPTFILDSKITQLNITWKCKANARLRAIFDHEFLTKFSLNDTRDLQFDAQDSKQPRWFASREFLPVICSYSELSMNSIVLTIDLLKVLIIQAFTSINVSLTIWNLSTTAPIDSSNLASFSRGMFSLEERRPANDDDEEEEDGEPSTFIIRKRDSRGRCELSMYGNQNDYGDYDISIVFNAM